MRQAYYNEHDPFAAQWLRELIRGGHIAPGYVDERSIEDVRPDDLTEFTQCHFFAGIGVWSYALRRAGWRDDSPVWTGSCPCQPFSAAGKGNGFADERHLWPAWFHLITQRNPPTIFGEQVASGDGLAWLDLVQTDLEAAGYATGAFDLCAAGVGAPHIRQRLFFVADASGKGLQRYRRPIGEHDSQGREIPIGLRSPSSYLDRMGDSELHGFPSDALARGIISGENKSGVQQPQRPDARNSLPPNPSPTNGFWRNADWLGCRDGKWRPVEPGTSPLVDGSAARVGRLRGYGNAINAEVATEFIRAYLNA